MKNIPQQPLQAIDAGKSIDWGKTSDDYAVYRLGPPLSFYQKLAALDIGLPHQKILDVGTGTGALALQFARQGAQVSGVDISSEQIQQAKKMAAHEKLDIHFEVSPAESTHFKMHTFDVITANQCWLYFKQKEMIAEVRRLLKSQGVLMTSLFSWLPRQDTIAAASEKLILKYNPQWNGNDYDGVIAPLPEWAVNDFVVKGFFYDDIYIPFTQETWRGRIRACRGVAAALSEEEVQRFDEEHAALLSKIVPEQFTILHRIAARILTFKS